VHPIADLPSLKRIDISHSEQDTMNIFYIIGVVVVIIVVAGFWACEYREKLASLARGVSNLIQTPSIGGAIAI
jgi:hypothetical protein